MLETHGAAFSTLALADHGVLVDVQDLVGATLDLGKGVRQVPGVQGESVVVVVGSLHAGPDLLVIAPARAYLVDGFLLAGLGDVLGLGGQLVLELGHVLVKPGGVPGLAQKLEQDRLVDALHRLLHTLRGEHAAVVVGENQPGLARQSAGDQPGNHPNRGERQNQGRHGEHETRAKSHPFTSSSTETM